MTSQFLEWLQDSWHDFTICGMFIVRRDGTPLKNEARPLNTNWLCLNSSNKAGTS
jgi:hypothetical protein